MYLSDLAMMKQKAKELQEMDCEVNEKPPHGNELPDEPEIKDVEWVRVHDQLKDIQRPVSGLSPDEFREKVRRLKQEDRRVIVALHLFAGGRRKGQTNDSCGSRC